MIILLPKFGFLTSPQQDTVFSQILSAETIQGRNYLRKNSIYKNRSDLVNLENPLAEQVPFLQTYAGTDYFDNGTAQYIEKENIQRGSWRTSGQC